MAKHSQTMLIDGFYSLKEQGVNQGNVIFNNLCASDHRAFVLKNIRVAPVTDHESGASLELLLSSYSNGF